MYSDRDKDKENPSQGGSGSGQQSTGSKGGGPRKPRDVKSRTMHKYTMYDEDVGSRYDFEEDEPPILTRRGGPLGRGSSSQLQQRGHSRIPIQQARQDNQLMRATAGSSRRDFIYKITVRNASRASKEVHRILVLLGESVDSFHPIAPRVNGSNIEFFLSKQEDAEAVRSMSMRVCDKSGRRLSIVSSRMAAPWDQLKPEHKTTIEEVVRSRYMGNLNSLDLADFPTDKKFTARDFHLPLFNNGVLVHVAGLIAREFGHVRGLSLKGNRLRSLDYVSTLVYCAPKVTELDLSSNALMRMEQLEPLRGWPVEKLHLENNELVSKYSNSEQYASDVHEIFPRVNYLDGASITPGSFSLDSDDFLTNAASLLPYRSGFCPLENQRVRELVEEFIVSYLNFYDGPDGEASRKNLMNAYDENAIFTFSIHSLFDTARTPKGDEDAFKNYIKSSHNIMQESKWGHYRDKIVYKGAMDIAVALSNLPVSSHIKESFTLDLNLITNTTITFTLQGILRDGRDAFKADGDCKFFVRNFVAISTGENSLAIVSDTLGLFPVSVERMERYNSLLKKAAAESISDQINNVLAPSSSNTVVMNGMQPVLMPPPPPTPQPQLQVAPMAVQPTPVQEYDRNDPAIQRAMIEQFSNLSGMKEEWSKKCLADMNWDFDAAGRIFITMKEQGAIPADAFK